jgi:signal transduction histidine kinase
MVKAPGEARRTVGTLTVLIALAVACSSPAVAVERYVVTAWGHRDGLPSTLIYAITQTRDGYLWLGTSDGLVRFDGITFDHQNLIVNSELMLGAVTALHGTHDGALWIGSASGLVTKMSGTQLSKYRIGSEIEAISETRSGDIWIFAKAGLYCFTSDGAREFAPVETVAAAQLIHMAETGTGGILVGGRRSGLVVENDTTKLLPTGRRSVTIGNRPFSLNEDQGGTVWLASHTNRQMQVAPIFWRDHRGHTWAGSSANGLLRTAPDGSTDDSDIRARQVESFLEDREGNIWVGTNNGLYRFRYGSVLSLTTRDGLSNDHVSSVVVERSRVWIGTESGLNVVENYRVRQCLRGIRVFVLKVSGDHTVWAGTNKGVFRLHGVGSSLQPELMVRELSSVTAIEEDSAGCVWLLDSDKGLYRWRDRVLLPVGTDPNFGGERISLMRAQSNDSVWIGFSGGGLSVYRNDAFNEWLQSAALNTGTIYDVYVEDPNLIWLAADNGLYALRGKAVTSWKAKNGLPGNRVLWLQPDGKDWFWLGFSTGIARVRRSDLNESERAGRRVACDFFDFEDGLLANPIRRSQAAVSQDPEHRLWVTTSAGMAIIDPRHIERNNVPPNVLIRRVIANNREMPVASTMQFPPGTRNLEIDYAGLSLAVPQQVRFRYRLEGFDKNWQDVDTRRQAFYTNLQPGPYRFQVLAANNDGVWNETGSSLDFTIQPTFRQTALFKVLCLAALTLLAFLLYRLRVRSLQAALSTRFEARLAERTRIAQELHDDLLQSAMGVSLQIELVDNLVDKPAEAKAHLQKALALSRALMQKGRAVLRDLRETTREASDLVKVLSAAIEDARYEGGPAAILLVGGAPRPVNPLVADDLGQIGCQAIVNAFQHSGAKNIEVQLDYKTSELGLRVIDDGCGIDPQIAESGKAGHYGVVGMRERANRIGGTLNIAGIDGDGNGTQVTASVPGRNAYRESRAHD